MVILSLVYFLHWPNQNSVWSIWSVMSVWSLELDFLFDIYGRMYLMSKIVSPFSLNGGWLKHFSFESQHQRLFFLITKSFPTSSSTWTFRTHVSWQSGVDHFLECTICPCFFSFQFFKLSFWSQYGWCELLNIP